MIFGKTYPLYYGDPWADFLPDQMIPDVLELIIDVWGNSVAWENIRRPSPVEREVPITKRFAIVLSRERNKHRIPLSITYEAVELQGGEEGRIDLRFSQGHRQEEVYFAFECKRLRIAYPDGIRSNAGEYVGNDGMMCFITGKYAPRMLLGGMIGYVMDGNVPEAMRSVVEAIRKDRERLHLRQGTVFSPSLLLPSYERVGRTEHNLEDRSLTLHHIFLSCALLTT